MQRSDTRTTSSVAQIGNTNVEKKKSQHTGRFQEKSEEKDRQTTKQLQASEQGKLDSELDAVLSNPNDFWAIWSKHHKSCKEREANGRSGDGCTCFEGIGSVV